MLPNYYQLLGVKPTASAQEIKTAYRNLVKKYHPDKTLDKGNNDEYLKKIIEAYSILNNPVKRKNYDLKVAYTTNANQPKNAFSSHKDSRARANSNNSNNKSANTNNKYKSPPPAAKVTPWAYIISLALIALVVTMFIKYPHGYEYQLALEELKKDRSMELNTTSADPSPTIFNNPQDSSNYYPYLTYFGRGNYDKLAKTTITIINNTAFDAILLLLDNKQPYQVIRNHYIKQGTVCYMLHIPNGVYFIRVYFGQQWNAKKKLFNTNNLQGGFEKEAGYFQFNRTTDLLIANQYQQGKNNVTINYETTLQQLYTDKTNQISEAYFWKLDLP